MPTPQQRFLEKIAHPYGVDCWIWSGFTHRGYGTFSIAGRSIPAHRYAYEHFSGPIPKGMVVMHRCDVRACVNPAHLALGTKRDNARDMVDKGRSCRGSSVNHARFTEQEVRFIRRSLHTNVYLADLFGVSRLAISNIRTRKTWAWLDAELDG